MQRKIVKTADGSDTILIDDLEVSYHSKHGAIQESEHVFIEAGLKHYHLEEWQGGAIRIFEMGLGTGLNLLLSSMYATTHKIAVEYTAVEKYPLSDDELQGINYAELLGEDADVIWKSLNNIEWGKEEQATDRVLLKKLLKGLEDYNADCLYDVIYYDAFAPKAQPELWTVDIFKKLYGMMRNKGLLVTYCSKGDVRRAMIAAGFEVEKLKGPPGKREMLRATKANG